MLKRKALVSSSAALTADYISSDNSTETPTPAFYGVMTRVTQYNTISISLLSDLPGVLKIEYSFTGDTIADYIAIPTVGGIFSYIKRPIQTPYIRIYWTSNPPALPTQLSIYTVFRKEGMTVADLSNEGTGREIYDADNVALRTLVSGDGSVVITQNAMEIDLSVLDPGAMNNEGAGVEIFDEVNGALRTLISSDASVGIALSGGPNLEVDLTVPPPFILGNEGTGVNVYDSGNDAIRSFISSDASVGIALSGGPNLEVDLTVPAPFVLGNEGTGVQVYDAPNDAIRSFISSDASVGIALGGVGNTEIDLTVAPFTLSNVGAGSQVYDTLTSGSLRTIKAANASMTVSTVGDEITLAATPFTLSNVGAGSQVYDTGTSGSLRTIKAANASMTVSTVGNEITLAATPFTLSNAAGTGSQVYDTGTSGTLRRIKAADASMTVTTVGNEIELAATGVGGGGDFVWRALCNVPSPTGSPSTFSNFSSTTNSASRIFRHSLPYDHTLSSVVISPQDGYCDFPTRLTGGALTFTLGTFPDDTDIDTIGSWTAVAGGPHWQIAGTAINTAVTTNHTFYFTGLNLLLSANTIYSLKVDNTTTNTSSTPVFPALYIVSTFTT